MFRNHIKSLINELDSNGNTPIHLAASINSLSTLRVLSKYKPDLNIKNVDLDRIVLREFSLVIYSPFPKITN